MNVHDHGINDWHGRAREFFAAGNTRPLEFRLAQLEKLAAAVKRYEPQLLRALHDDLGKSPTESVLSETGWIINDIRYTRRRLAKWMRPCPHRTPRVIRPGRSIVYPEPLGLVLVMAPWNFPLQLLFAPLVSAIAAGNVVCLKPSELTPTVAGVAAELIAATFPAEYVCVCQGDRTVAEALLDLRFDHIFFTGSVATGRRVMAAAARFPTPVTLELGGKSPCVVCADADLPVTARRIAWGKFMNAGQVCVAPDYVLVERSAAEQLIEELRRAIHKFYGAVPSRSRDYGRIINAAHLERLSGYLRDQKVVMGGECDASAMRMAPTILWDSPLDSPVMHEEIFGPILPIIPFDDINNALQQINSRPTPLALYLFTSNQDTQELVCRGTRSGGMAINDTIIQIFNRDLPFGGVGDSGMGAYHGQVGFDTFTHYRPVVNRGFRPDPSFRYPPFRLPVCMLKLVSRMLG